MIHHYIIIIFNVQHKYWQKIFPTNRIYNNS